MRTDQDLPILFCPVGDAQHHATLRNTCAQATTTGTPVELLAVIEEPGTWDRLAHSDHVERIERDLYSSWTNTLSRWEREFHMVSDIEIRIGSTAEVIVERAKDIGASTIVLSMAHTPDDLAIAKRVIRLSAVPVWTMRPTRAKARRILVAVNPEVDDLDLNLSIMTAAEQLSKQLDASLVLMTAWELYGEQTMRRSAFLKTPEPQFHDLFDLREQISMKGLEELAAVSSDSTAWTLHLEKGPPAPSILRAANKHKSNLIVIGTVGRSGLSGLLMGNTAEYVLDGARCSVYAVHAPGGM